MATTMLWRPKLSLSSRMSAGLRTAAVLRQTFSTPRLNSRAASSRIPAVAYRQGTPLRNEIESRDAAGPASATALCADALARRFGAGTVDGKIQAHIVAVEA